MNPRHSQAWAIGVVAALAPSAPAQNDPTDLPGAQPVRAAANAESGPVRLSVFGGGVAQFQADFQHSDATIATYRAHTGAVLSWRASEAVSLNFGITYEAAFYDITNGQDVFPTLGEDDPFGTLQSVAFAASGQWTFSDPWYAIGAGFATAGWESGADFSEAWVFGGFGGIGYKFSDRFTLALGAGGTTRLEDDPLVYPVIVVRWRATDHLLVESEGLGVRVTSTISDQFDAFFRAGYAGRSYRLDEDRSSEPNAALEDRSVFVGLGVAWKPIEGLEVALEAGAMVYRELELRDSSGDKVTEHEADIAPYIGLRVRYAF